MRKQPGQCKVQGHRFYVSATVIVSLAAIGGSAFAKESSLSQLLPAICETNASFSATAHTTITRPAGREPFVNDIGLAFSGGKLRMEVDLVATEASAEVVARTRKAGADRLVTIWRPDLDKGYFILPGRKSYGVEDLSSASGPPFQRWNVSEVHRTELGHETVEGHACVSYRVIASFENGATNEVVIWEASDLKNLPIKLVRKSGESTATAVLRDINLQPSPGLFEPPADYKRYNSLEELDNALGSFGP
jgi:hypothetical protein